jgi:hypothetical protein
VHTSLQGERDGERVEIDERGRGRRGEKQEIKVEGKEGRSERDRGVTKERREEQVKEKA